MKFLLAFLSQMNNSSDKPNMSVVTYNEIEKTNYWILLFLSYVDSFKSMLGLTIGLAISIRIVNYLLKRAKALYELNIETLSKDDAKKVLSLFKEMYPKMEKTIGSLERVKDRLKDVKGLGHLKDFTIKEEIISNYKNFLEFLEDQIESIEISLDDRVVKGLEDAIKNLPEEDESTPPWREVIDRI